MYSVAILDLFLIIADEKSEKISRIETFNQTGWYICNVLNLYSESTRFEFQPSHRAF
jgi:hypothetical protein